MKEQIKEFLESLIGQKFNEFTFGFADEDMGTYGLIRNTIRFDGEESETVIACTPFWNGEEAISFQLIIDGESEAEWQIDYPMPDTAEMLRVFKNLYVHVVGMQSLRHASLKAQLEWWNSQDENWQQERIDEWYELCFSDVPSEYAETEDGVTVWAYKKYFIKSLEK